MAIRFVHQLGPSGGLAAYAAGQGRARARAARYGRYGRGRGKVGAALPPAGRWVNPLEAENPFFAGLPEDEQVQMRRQQRAQMRAAGRKYRLGKAYQGDLLPRFQPQAEIDRFQKMEDAERDRALGLEDEARKRGFALEDDRRRFGREDAREARRWATGVVSGIRIPEGATETARRDAEKAIAYAKEFLAPNVDLTDPDQLSAFEATVEDAMDIVRGVEMKDPDDIVRENEYWRDPVTKEVVPAGTPGAVPFDRRDHRQIDVSPPEDPAVTAAAGSLVQQQEAYSTYHDTIDKRFKELEDAVDANGDPLDDDTRYARAKKDVDFLRSKRGLAPITAESVTGAASDASHAATGKYTADDPLMQLGASGPLPGMDASGPPPGVRATPQAEADQIASRMGAVQDEIAQLEEGGSRSARAQLLPRRRALMERLQQRQRELQQEMETGVVPPKRSARDFKSSADLLRKHGNARAADAMQELADMRKKYPDGKLPAKAAARLQELMKILQGE